MEQIFYFCIGGLVVVAIGLAATSDSAIDMLAAAIFLAGAVVAHVAYSHYSRAETFTPAEVCRMLGQMNATMFFSVPALARAAGMDEERAEALLEILTQENVAEKSGLRRTHNNSIEYGYRRVR